jgi:hypothetical protein
MYGYLDGRNARTNMDDMCHFRHTVELPKGNCYPRSFYRLLCLLGIDLNNLDTHRQEYHTCPNGCFMNFPTLASAEWELHRNCKTACRTCHCACGGKRFDIEDSSRIVPNAWGLYFGVEYAEKSLDKNINYREAFAAFQRDKKPEDAFQAPDVHVSPHFESIDASVLLSHGVSVYKNDETRLYNIAVDWESMFNRTAWSTGVVMYEPMDVPVFNRSQIKYSRCLQLIAGPYEPKHIAGHFYLLCNEVKDLQERGSVSAIDGKLRRSILCSFDGDTPARCKCFCLRSHTSYNFCWRCRFLATRVTAQKKDTTNADETSTTLRWLGYAAPVQQTVRSEMLKTAAEVNAQKKRKTGNRYVCIL